MPRKFGGQEATDALQWLRTQHQPGGPKAINADGVPLPLGSPCCICGGNIDYTLRYPHPESLSLQHIKPQKWYPELARIRSNWGPSHLNCNVALGDKEEAPGGEFVYVYWPTR